VRESPGVEITQTSGEYLNKLRALSRYVDGQEAIIRGVSSWTKFFFGGEGWLSGAVKQIRRDITSRDLHNAFHDVLNLEGEKGGPREELVRMQDDVFAVNLAIVSQHQREFGDKMKMSDEQKKFIDEVFGGKRVSDLLRKNPGFVLPQGVKETDFATYFNYFTMKDSSKNRDKFIETMAAIARADIWRGLGDGSISFEEAVKRFKEQQLGVGKGEDCIDGLAAVSREQKRFLRDKRRSEYVVLFSLVEAIGFGETTDYWGID